MKEKFLIFGALLLLIVVLIGLNTASYVQQEKKPDTEMSPNRSTYNVGATGTRALFDLLSETGRRVERWQDPTSALLTYGPNSPSTFVIIGETRVEFTNAEIEELLLWVSGGGRLVLIDRDVPGEFLKTENGWKLSLSEGEFPGFNLDPANQKAMIGNTAAAKPVQPTVSTARTNAVQPSRFASAISFFRERVDSPQTADEFPADPPLVAEPPSDHPGDSDSAPVNEEPPEVSKPGTVEPMNPEGNGPPAEVDSEDHGSLAENWLSSPVVHLANSEKNILVEYPWGDGTILILSDPFIVSNGGINLVDNSQLAIDLLDANGGIIAFDEYHQGYGKNNNRLIAYFEGTPVIAFFLQILAIAAFIFYSRSRRFARALPPGEPDRLSKLEYVAAMAELQQRTKAYDLAMENIYKDFRRRVSKLVGVDNFTVSRTDLAHSIAERLGEKRETIEETLRKCEDIGHGEPTNKTEVISLTARLREIENGLGLHRGRN